MRLLLQIDARKLPQQEAGLPAQVLSAAGGARSQVRGEHADAHPEGARRRHGGRDGAGRHRTGNMIWIAVNISVGTLFKTLMCQIIHIIAFVSP